MNKIIIADDHPVIRAGIISILKHDMGLQVEIYEAGEGNQVIEYTKNHRVDILIMDVNMPDTDAQMLVRTILARQPRVNIMVLSVNKEEIFGPLFLKLGVKAFVSKESGEEELIRALKHVINGEIYIKKNLKDIYEKNIQNNPYSEVTMREMEILSHLVKGASTAQISKIMNISISTTSTHKASLFKKLHIANVLELKQLVELYPL